MSPLAVHVKHGGKVHDVQLDPDRPASVFKDAIYQVTGVPLDRMKVMIKGDILKVGTWPTCAIANAHLDIVFDLSLVWIG